MKNHTTDKKPNQDSCNPRHSNGPTITCYPITLPDSWTPLVPVYAATGHPAILTPRISTEQPCKTKERTTGKQRLFTLPEAADYLGRTLWSMRHLAWNGSLPIVREGKRIFVDVDDLDKYIEGNKTSEPEPLMFKKNLSRKEAKAVKPKQSKRKVR